MIREYLNEHIKTSPRFARDEVFYFTLVDSDRDNYFLAMYFTLSMSLKCSSCVHNVAL